MKVFPLIVLAIVCCSCQSPRVYYWGHYEPLTYATLAKPDTVSVEEQIIFLEEDIEIGRSKDLPPPPGMYAHLAYLYLQTGSIDKAVVAFETEKTLFPESEAFINRLLERLTTPEPVS